MQLQDTRSTQTIIYGRVKENNELSRAASPHDFLTFPIFIIQARVILYRNYIKLFTYQFIIQQTSGRNFEMMDREFVSS